MLVITRKPGEEIAITVGDERVVVRIVEFKSGRKVRVGIQHGPAVTVERDDMKRDRLGNSVGDIA